MAGDEDSDWAAAKPRKGIVKKNSETKVLNFKSFQPPSLSSLSQVRAASPLPSGASIGSPSGVAGDDASLVSPLNAAKPFARIGTKRRKMDSARVLTLPDLSAVVTGDWSIKRQVTAWLPCKEEIDIQPSSLSEASGIRRFLGHLSPSLRGSSPVNDLWELTYSNCLCFQFPAEDLPTSLAQAWAVHERKRDDESRQTNGSGTVSTPISSTKPEKAFGGFGTSQQQNPGPEGDSSYVSSLRMRWLESFRSLFAAYCQSARGSFYIVSETLSALFFKYSDLNDRTAEAALVNFRKTKLDFLSMLDQEGVEYCELKNKESTEEDMVSPSIKQGKTIVLQKDDLSALVEILNDLPFPEGVPRLISDGPFLHASLKPAEVQAKRVYSSQLANKGSSSRHPSSLEELTTAVSAEEALPTFPSKEMWQIDITGQVLPSAVAGLATVFSRVSSDFLLSLSADSQTSMFALVTADSERQTALSLRNSTASPSLLPSPLSPIVKALSADVPFLFSPRGILKRVSSCPGGFRVEIGKSM